MHLGFLNKSQDGIFAGEAIFHLCQLGNNLLSQLSREGGPRFDLDCQLLNYLLSRKVDLTNSKLRLLRVENCRSMALTPSNECQLGCFCLRELESLRSDQLFAFLVA